MPDRLDSDTTHWLYYAQEDLDSAILLTKTSPRNACLLSQQSAEKALKSIHIFLKQPFPKSHDLDLIKNLLPNDWQQKINFDNLSELTIWAVESRYPSNLPDATEEEAQSAVRLSKLILDCVTKLLFEDI
jgi:HEPN domain-containing protein